MGNLDVKLLEELGLHDSGGEISKLKYSIATTLRRLAHQSTLRIRAAFTFSTTKSFTRMRISLQNLKASRTATAARPPLYVDERALRHRTDRGGAIILMCNPRVLA